ncbi:MFS transporter [Gracilinema caldarium]|uniref:Major facilitator superfamily MFS_1 n=1 Tax=Gracilinema caldarium (strain ATCC 51460 / DSM 7334 / H1) TaxID=744872 RepID=F8F2H6_GRAC1|nr:MFS transporter [Gracilinema caldarium]AEJ19091.1 major facilitator superfamily MFS_1 [Gracilinema caldarium DSM 7334]
MNLGIVFFFAFTVYGVASPYLSVLVRDLGYPPSMVGLLLGLFEIAGIVGPFFIGRYSDSRGRYRPGLFIVLLIIPLALIPLLIWRHILVTTIALILLAFGIRSIIPLLDAAATLLLTKKDDYGKIRSIGSLSFVLTALLLQFTPVLQPHTAFAIGIWLGITALAAMITLPLLREGAIHQPEFKNEIEPTLSNNAGTHPAFPPVFIIGLIIIALGRLSMAPIASFFSLYVSEELHWNAVGLMWALSAVSEIPFMFISGRLLRKYGAAPLIALSMVAVIARLGFYAFYPTMGGAIIGQLLHSLCYGLFHPAAVAFVSTHVPPQKRAVGLTMYISLGVGLPTFIGSALGGYVVEFFGYRILFGSYTIFSFIGLIVYVIFRQSLSEKTEGR